MSIYSFNKIEDYKKINNFCIENGFELSLNNFCITNELMDDKYLKYTLFTIKEHYKKDDIKSKLTLSYNVFDFKSISYDDKVKNNAYILAFHSDYNTFDILEKCKNLNYYREIKIIKNLGYLRNSIYFCFDYSLETEHIFELLNAIYLVSKKENLKTIDYKEDKLF